MTSTSVHFPAANVAQLDRVAAQRGTSRNRIILRACEELLAEQHRDWPQGFFDASLSPADQAILQESGQEMETAIYAARRDRPVPPL